MKLWLLLQGNYDEKNKDKVTSLLTKSVFNKNDVFNELMIKTNENYIDGLYFNNINGEWKLSSVILDWEGYEVIEKLIDKKK